VTPAREHHHASRLATAESGFHRVLAG